MNTHHDYEMATLLHAGEVEGFNHFFEQHYPALLFFTHRLLSNESEAEEVAEDAFVKLWERKQQYTTPGSIKAFLFHAARNSCIDVLRKRKTALSFQQEAAYLLDKEEEPVVHGMIRAELVAIIQHQIGKLPPQCKKVFQLFYLEQKSYEEIAAELKLSINNVRNQKARALQLLRGIVGSSLLLSLFFL